MLAGFLASALYGVKDGEILYRYTGEYIPHVRALDLQRCRPAVSSGDATAYARCCGATGTGTW